MYYINAMHLLCMAWPNFGKNPVSLDSHFVIKYHKAQIIEKKTTQNIHSLHSEIIEKTKKTVKHSKNDQVRHIHMYGYK